MGFISRVAGRMTRLSRWAILCGVALSCILVAGAGIPSDVQVKDRAKIYLGDPDRFAKPAVVTASRVYAEITEYQEVKRRQIDRNDPDFYVLMEKAARKFRSALEESAKSGPYDLVGEKGAVTRTEGTLPDLTDAAVEEVKKLQKT
jgi:maltooligosyltrehalose synthase